MTAPEDGGPAFPHDSTRNNCGRVGDDTHPGMTLRDYFAAAAMTGLLARGEPEYQPHASRREPGIYIQDTAFRLADAMLSERRRTQGSREGE